MVPNNDGQRARQRRQAKAGMAVALGVLVSSGFLAHRRQAGIAHGVHIAAGISLVGLAYWHWSLYQKSGQGGGPRR